MSIQGALKDLWQSVVKPEHLAYRKAMMHAWDNSSQGCLSTELTLLSKYRETAYMGLFLTVICLLRHQTDTLTSGELKAMALALCITGGVNATHYRKHHLEMHIEDRKLHVKLIKKTEAGHATHSHIFDIDRIKVSVEEEDRTLTIQEIEIGKPSKRLAIDLEYFGSKATQKGLEQALNDIADLFCQNSEAKIAPDFWRDNRPVDPDDLKCG